MQNIIYLTLIASESALRYLNLSVPLSMLKASLVAYWVSTPLWFRYNCFL